MDRRGWLYDSRSRIINSAYVIEELSFIEAIELSNFGAKVIYPPTIFPVYHKNIPIRVKNTFRPECEGTLIRNIAPDPNGQIIKGISSINDTALITIQGLGMVCVIGVNKRIFLPWPTTVSASSSFHRPHLKTVPP